MKNTTRNLDITWEQDDDGTGRLRAAQLVTVNGFYMHLEAYAIEKALDDDGAVLDYLPRDPIYEEDVRAVLNLEGDTWPQLTEIAGFPGEWLLVAIPHGE